MKRSLSLKSETLVELTAADLSSVNGAAQALSVNGKCTLDPSFIICPTIPQTYDCG